MASCREEEAGKRPASLPGFMRSLVCLLGSVGAGSVVQEMSPEGWVGRMGGLPRKGLL